MKTIINFKKIILISFFVLSYPILAANPPAPFLPSDNIQDPNCTPEDSNCYVLLTSFQNETVEGLEYATSTGILSLESGYTIPTVASTTAWETAIGALGGSALIQNGNSFGNTLVLGTNDNQALSFKTNGNTAMTILSNGNVGVGVSDPTFKLGFAYDNSATIGVEPNPNYAAPGGDLTIAAGTGSAGGNSGGSLILRAGNAYTGTGENAGDIRLYAGANNFSSGANMGNIIFYKGGQNGLNTEAFRMNNDGNIGIGTSTPGSILTVVGNSYVSGTSRFVDALSVDTRINFGAQNYGSILPGNNYGRLLFNDAGNATGGIVLQLAGNDSANNAIRGVTGGGIDFLKGDLSAYATTTAQGGIFYGNVGIGTISPSDKLHVVSSSGDAGITLSGNNSPKLVIETSDSSYPGTILRTNGNSARFELTPSGVLRFKTDGSTGLDFQTNSTSRMYISDTGNVGIGTTTPSSLLVVGNNFSIDSNGRTYLGALANTYTSLDAGLAAMGRTGNDVPAIVARSNAFQNGSANALQSWQANNGSALMTFTNAGKLGIGTTTPSSILTLARSATTTGGISFGGDTVLYRNAPGALVLNSDSVSGNATGLLLSNNTLTGTGNYELKLQGYDGDDAGSIYIRKGGTNQNAFYSYGGTNTTDGHSFYTGGAPSSAQTLRFNVNNDRAYFNTNVGIGTTTPNSKLDVYGDIRTSTGSNDYLAMRMVGGVPTLRSNTDSGQALTFDNNSQTFMSLATNAFGGNTYSNLTLSTGMSRQLGIQSQNSLNFFTNNNSTPRLIIDTSGNVGIGTSTPTGALDVVRSNGAAMNLISTDATPTTWAEITAKNGNGVYTKVGNYGTAGEIGTVSNHDLRISTNNSTRMIITADGNVGIGTTTPTEKLSIAGNINLTGALKINGDTGTNGYVLQTTGTGVQWVSTSSLQISPDLNILSNIIFGNGNATTTVGANSVAIGYRNSSTVLNSVLIGNQNFVGSASTTVALGILNNSSGASINTSNGAISGTITATSTIGLLSTSVGILNSSRALQSQVFGYGNVTSAPYSLAAGFLNTITSASADRATAVGANNTVSGIDGSMAVGYSNTVSGTGAMGFGRANIAAGNLSMIYGFANDITGGAAAAYSAAFGYDNTVTSAAASYAFGNTNTLTAGSSYVFGANITNAIANSVMIGPSNTAKMTILNSGNVGVGTTTALDRLQVFGDIRVGTSSTNGCIKDFSGTGFAGTCSSDERLKTNVVDLSDGYLDKMSNLRVITYNWNEQADIVNKVDTTVTNYGLLAQNVEQSFPELVTTDSNGYKQVNYSRIPLYLLKSLQELTKKVMSFSDEFRTKKLCVGDTCIDENQLKILLQNQNVQYVPTSPTIVETVPVVETPTNEEVVPEESTPEPEVVVVGPTPEPTPEPEVVVVEPTPTPTE